MGVQIERTDLPGIGFRDDIHTKDGQRIGILTLRTGGHELVMYSADDPDAGVAQVSLTDPESAVLAELLGHALLLHQLAEVGGGVAGLFTEHLAMPADSKYVGETLGSAKVRTKTGVSIVAIVRETEVIPSPVPDDVLEAGDVLVAVGTRDGLDAAVKILANAKA